MNYWVAVVAAASAPALAANTLAPIDVRLACPIQGAFLDGTVILGQATEEVVIKAQPVQLRNDKSGRSGWFSDAKITSNRRVFEASLLANGKDYAIVGYGNHIREGLKGSLLGAVYQFNLATLEFKRTVTFFPDRRDSLSQGVCKKM